MCSVNLTVVFHTETRSISVWPMHLQMQILCVSKALKTQSLIIQCRNVVIYVCEPKHTLSSHLSMVEIFDSMYVIEFLLIC